MSATFAIRNVQLLEDGQTIPNGLVLVDGGRIRYAGPESEAPPLARAAAIDGEGRYIAPGYIDLQLNGGYGHDFTENPHTLLEVARRLPEIGVTAFLPTFITSPLQAYPPMLQAVVQAQAYQRENPGAGARLLGAHIEGPFLSPLRKGAHRQEYFCDPTPEALEYLQPLEAVRLLTLAPERPGAFNAISQLSQRGIVVSIGHSDAGWEEVERARKNGAVYATHLYNAMRPMHHRDPGVVGSLLTSDAFICGLIVDELHVHPEMVKLAYRCLGPRAITLVTDAMAAMGMPPGNYSIGGKRVIVDGMLASLEDGTLAGSVLTMDWAVRYMHWFSGCSVAEAVRMATTTPVEVLKIDNEVGHLLPGYRADLILLDQDLNVRGTFIDGERVF